MIDASAKRAVGPGVNNINRDRGVNRHGGMQRFRRLPRLEANAANEFQRNPCRRHGHLAAIDCDLVAALHESRRAQLQTLHGCIDKPHRAADGAFFAQHMPGLQRLPDFELHAAMLDNSKHRKPELELRFEPRHVEFISGALQIGERAAKILLDEIGQHEPVMQRRAPTHQRTLLRLTPEPGDECAQQ